MNHKQMFDYLKENLKILVVDDTPILGVNDDGTGNVCRLVRLSLLNPESGEVEMIDEERLEPQDKKFWKSQYFLQCKNSAFP